MRPAAGSIVVRQILAAALLLALVPASRRGSGIPAPGMPTSATTTVPSVIPISSSRVHSATRPVLETATNLPIDTVIREHPVTVAAIVPPPHRETISTVLHWTGALAPHDGEALLLDLRLGRESAGMMRAYLREDRPYLPLMPIYTLAGYRIRDDRDGWILRPAGDRDDGLRLDRTGQLQGTSTERVPLWIGPDDQPYLPAELLTTLLQAEVSVDLERAVVLLAPDDDLPAIRARRRQEARTLLLVQAQTPDAPAHWARISGARGAVLDYHLAGGSRMARYDIGLAVPVAAGVLDLRWIGAETRDALPAEFAWTLLGEPGSRLSQLRLGDGAGTGLRPMMQRGLMLTNAPLWRPLVVEALPFQAALPPGWSIDAYRAGRLVAFDTAGSAGRYRMTLPLNAGENPIDFLAYGPGGEVTSFQRMFRAMPTMLTRGAIEYGLSAGRCTDRHCDWGGNADLRAGLSRAVTVRTGLTHERLGSRARWQPYGAVTVAPPGAVSLEAEHAPGSYSRLALRLEPDAALRMTFDASRLAPTAASLAQTEAWLSAHYLPGGPGSSLAFEFLGTQRRDAIHHQEEFQVGAVFTRGDMQLRPSLRWERAGPAATRTLLGIETTLQPHSAIGAKLGRTWLRGELQATTDGTPTMAALSVVRTLSATTHLDAAVRWTDMTPGARFILGLQADLPSVRATTRASSGTNGLMEQSLEGSVRWDEASRALSFSASAGMQKTGIVAQLFLDRNGDGERQDDEAPIADARVVIAGQLLVSDSLGRVQRWGLQAWEPVAIVVDTFSLASPKWIPVHGTLLVAPRPDRVALVALPVVEGATVEGRIALADDLSFGGVLPLTLRNLRTQEVLRPEVFADGTFYFAGVKPGSYLLEVESSARTLLQLAARALPVEVGASPAGENGVRALALRIERDLTAPTRSATSAGPPSGSRPPDSR